MITGKKTPLKNYNFPKICQKYYSAKKSHLRLKIKKLSTIFSEKRDRWTRTPYSKLILQIKSKDKVEITTSFSTILTKMIISRCQIIILRPMFKFLKFQLVVYTVVGVKMKTCQNCKKKRLKLVVKTTYIL